MHFFIIYVNFDCKKGNTISFVLQQDHEYMIFHVEEEEEDKKFIFARDEIQIIKVHICVRVMRHVVFGNILQYPILTCC